MSHQLRALQPCHVIPWLWGQAGKEQEQEQAGFPLQHPTSFLLPLCEQHSLCGTRAEQEWHKPCHPKKMPSGTGSSGDQG